MDRIPGKGGAVRMVLVYEVASEFWDEMLPALPSVGMCRALNLSQPVPAPSFLHRLESPRTGQGGWWEVVVLRQSPLGDVGILQIPGAGC